jgi:hypothetical protein
MTLWDSVRSCDPPDGLGWSMAEAFDVSDVMAMVFESENDAILDWGSLPNIAPPFERFFMFGRCPKVYRAEGKSAQFPPGSSLGALFTARKIPGGGWDLTAVSVGGPSGSHYWQDATLRVRVGVSGEMEPVNERGDRFALSVGYKPDIPDGLTENDVVNGFAGVVYPLFLAISLLHCKNVSARSVKVPPKLAAACERRGRPRYSYSVLDVAPMRAVLRDEGGMGRGNSIQRALHICRGHFKDYRAGAGLFGRHKSVFWWEQSVKGNAASGVRVKDYSVSV